MYLRMLQRSVDGIGGSGLGEAAGGVASQPRLLVPIVLVLAANRCGVGREPRHPDVMSER